MVACGETNWTINADYCVQKPITPVPADTCTPGRCCGRSVRKWGAARGAPSSPISFPPRFNEVRVRLNVIPAAIARAPAFPMLPDQSSSERRAVLVASAAPNATAPAAGAALVSEAGAGSYASTAGLKSTHSQPDKHAAA